MSKIFISYRRDDSADIAGRIYDHLIQPVGPFADEAVFKDVDSIPLGVNFKKYLEDKVKECSLTLVIIGPNWLGVEHESGQRRIDNPQDFVRIEVETALKREIPVIPLLVGRASMPQEQQLPASLAELAYRNGTPIRRDPDFKSDMARLVKSLQKWLEGLSEISNVQQEQNPASEIDKLPPTDEVINPDSSSYEKLALWLAKQTESEISLTFAEVEEIMEEKLPPSALTHRAWWANDAVSHQHSQRWLDAGWRVKKLNVTNRVVVFARILERQLAYLEFYSDVLRSIKEQPNLPLKQIMPTSTSWHNLISVPAGGPQLMVIGISFTYDKRFRIELYIDTGDKERNKAAFDILKAQSADVEANLSSLLTWDRIDNKRASRISLYYPDNVSILSTPQELENLQNWIVPNVVSFYEVLYQKAVEALRKTK